MQGTVYLKTFGCRVNQYETEGLREALSSGGRVEEVSDYRDADLCVVNTCTVTRRADKDALLLLRRISRRNPGARIVVTGCLATHSPDAVREAAPGAMVVSNKEKLDIPALLEPGAAAGESVNRGLSGRSRAFVKVQDGCRMGCSYCVVPLVRPELASKPWAAVEREVRGLVRAGYPEIVLCGIRLGTYRAGSLRFAGLVERLARLPGDFRVRLSSLEITDVTKRLLDLFEGAPERLAPSFHLPLQSGSDPVLKRMGRWYTTGYFARRVDALRARLPGAGLFSDVMVGFPGERAADFEGTVRFVEGTGFSGLHIFRYSRRPGTRAAKAGGQLPPEILLARARRLRALDRRLRTAFAREAVGTRRTVVVEAKEGRSVFGLTEHFLRVRLDRDPGPGLRRVRVVSADGPEARGKVE